MALVQKTTVALANTTVTATFPNNTTAGNFLVIVGVYDNATAPSVNSGWSQAGITLLSSTANGFIWYQQDIAGGQTSYQWTMPGSSYTVATVYEYSGIATTSAFDQYNGASGNGSSITAGSITTTAAQELLLFGYIVTNANTATVSNLTSGYTQEDTAAGAGGTAWIGSADETTTATGTFSPSISLSAASNFIGVQASFKLAGPSTVSLGTCAMSAVSSEAATLSLGAALSVNAGATSGFTTTGPTDGLNVGQDNMSAVTTMSAPLLLGMQFQQLLTNQTSMLATLSAALAFQMSVQSVTTFLATIAAGLGLGTVPITSLSEVLANLQSGASLSSAIRSSSSMVPNMWDNVPVSVKMEALSSLVATFSLQYYVHEVIIIMVANKITFDSSFPRRAEVQPVFIEPPAPTDMLAEKGVVLTTSPTTSVEIDVSGYTRAEVDLNVTALTGTLTVSWQRIDANGNPITVASTPSISATGTYILDIGPGLANNALIGSTIQLLYTLAGTTPSATFDVAITVF